MATIKRHLTTDDLVTIGSPTSNLLNVTTYGATGNGITDDTISIQAAINAIPTTPTASGIYFPRGSYLLTSPLLVKALRGFHMQGAGKVTLDAGTQLGTLLIGSGLSGSPVIDLGGGEVLPSTDGPNAFRISDLSIKGNTTNSLTGAASFGIRLRGTGSGDGLIENVGISYCVEGFNCGNAGPDANASDLTFLRSNIQHCTTGFHSEIDQALDYDFYGCAFQFCADTFKLTAGNLLASMLSTYDVQRVVYLIQGGDNIGYVTVINLRADGTTYRTILAETHADCVGGLINFINPHCITGQPSSGAARIKLTNNNMLTLNGGVNLCGTPGKLFDLDGSGGNCSILVTGTQLPTDTTKVVGSVTGSAKYRVRECFIQSTGGFITNYEN